MSRYREPLSMGRMLKRIALFGGIPIMSISVVVGFLLFLRAPEKVQISLGDSGDSIESSAANSASGSTHAAPSTAPGSAPASSTADSGSAGSIGASDPVEAATLWLTYYRSVSWADPLPTTWLGRLAPYITPELQAEYEDSVDSSSTTGGWTTLVSGKCETTVDNASGSLAAGAPADPSNTQVNITGTVTTSCASGTTPTPDESVTAVVGVTKADSGRWLVSERVS